MECFRCNQRDFDVLRPSIFGLVAVKCFNCQQQFLIESKLNLMPVELLGLFSDIEKECIVKKCTFCNTKRYIAVDCTHLNLQSCSFCNMSTVPSGEKISWEEFFKRSSNIDGDVPVS